MSAVRIVLNLPGFDAYRNTPEVTALVEQAGQSVSERFEGGLDRYGPPSGTPDSYVNTVHAGDRVRVYVGTSSHRARIAEARDRLLLAALGGAP